MIQTLLCKPSADAKREMVRRRNSNHAPPWLQLFVKRGVLFYTPNQTVEPSPTRLSTPGNVTEIPVAQRHLVPHWP